MDEKTVHACFNYADGPICGKPLRAFGDDDALKVEPFRLYDGDDKCWECKSIVEI